ncbi:MAG: 50S ribosomal protein L5 [Armatimonadetes bacterium]|nr:50S ribosomal protein L5 [Armatimonadota bacterium]
MARLKDRYASEILPALMERFGYKNIWQAPRLEKVCINMGVGQAKDNADTLDAAAKELTTIAGQKVVITKAKKSISAFGIRQGMNIGCRVTLRGDRMWEFADRLLSVALPRIRDFRGVSRNAFDGRGNYTFGLDDQLIFPELGYDDIERQRGLEITFVTTARTDEEALALLEMLGVPFVRAAA